jgi:hypothetical protein
MDIYKGNYLHKSPSIKAQTKSGTGISKEMVG